MEKSLKSKLFGAGERPAPVLLLKQSVQRTAFVFDRSPWSPSMPLPDLMKSSMGLFCSFAEPWPVIVADEHHIAGVMRLNSSPIEIKSRCVVKNLAHEPNRRLSRVRTIDWPLKISTNRIGCVNHADDGKQSDTARQELPHAHHYISVVRRQSRSKVLVLLSTKPQETQRLASY